MSVNLSVPKVARIAILNPYLDLGVMENSELESMHRFIAAAKNMGIEAAMFKSSNDLYHYNPDFVLAISPQEPKLTHFPTYGLFLKPIKWMMTSKRFIRNLFSYDGYFTTSDIALNWLQRICQATHKQLYAASATFSAASSEFKPRDFRTATAAYLGVNWFDVNLFASFRYFQANDLLKCYGPKEHWTNYPAHLYGGEVAYDGYSALKKYAEHGIGLCLQHPDLDAESIPSHLSFEISAASAIMITTPNAYIKKHYGDSVLYLDTNLSPAQLADNIKDKIQWVRDHPNEALEMVKSAHEIFNRELAQEVYLANMLKMHHSVILNDGYKKTTAPTSSAKITYLIHVDNPDVLSQVLHTVNQQSHENTQIVLLADHQQSALKNKLATFCNQRITTLHYTDAQCNAAIFKFLQETKTTWFGFLNIDDKLFPHHCTKLLQCYEASTHDKNREFLTLVFGNSLEHSIEANLHDKIQDQQLLYPSSNVRIGNITPCAQIPLCATLFKLNPAILTAFETSDFTTPLRLDFQSSVDPLEIAIHSNTVTCSASVTHPDKQAVLIIHNGKSPLNFDDQANNVNMIHQRDYQSTLDRTFYQQPLPVTDDPKKYSHTVAIILRTKDRPVCLPRAIQSILSQSFKDWFLVIVNDGGNVETLKKCLEPFNQALQNRMRLINNATSLGMSRGANLAIDASSSEFIVVHDDDDTWHPEFLRHTVAFLRNPDNSDCCAVITHSTRVLEEIINDSIVERARTDYNAKDNPFPRVNLYRLLMRNTITTNAYLFRRSIIAQIGYFNEDLPVLNDWDFNIRCALQAEIGVIPQYLANYHHRTNQQNSTYGNSIIHTSSLCVQYETVIRNQGLRNVIHSKNHSELLGLVFALGGQELQNVYIPDNINILGNYLQQIPQIVEKCVKNSVTNEINTMRSQLTTLQTKLDKLLAATS